MKMFIFICFVCIYLNKYRAITTKDNHNKSNIVIKHVLYICTYLDTAIVICISHITPMLSLIKTMNRKTMNYLDIFYQELVCIIYSVYIIECVMHIVYINS